MPQISPLSWIFIPFMFFLFFFLLVVGFWWFNKKFFTFSSLDTSDESVDLVWKW